MRTGRIGRRDFLRDGSTLVAGAAAGGTLAARGAETPAAGRKILNFNPKRGYRRLGKAGLMISEISLGGYWASCYRVEGMRRLIVASLVWAARRD